MIAKKQIALQILVVVTCFVAFASVGGLAANFFFPLCPSERRPYWLPICSAIAIVAPFSMVLSLMVVRFVIGRLHKLSVLLFSLLTPFVVFAFLTYGSGYPEHFCRWFPHIDTVMTKGLNQKGWDAVQHGMCKEEVLLHLGEPLESTETAWQYTKDGRCKVLDFAWELRRIHFNDDGLVESKEARWFFD